MKKPTQNTLFKKYPDAMSLGDLAEALGVSTKLASRLVRDGEIYAVKVGREYRIAKTAVIDYIKGKGRPTVSKNYVVNVTSNPNSWTSPEVCDIVCTAENVKEVC